MVAIGGEEGKETKNPHVNVGKNTSWCSFAGTTDSHPPKSSGFVQMDRTVSDPFTSLPSPRREGRPGPAIWSIDDVKTN